MTSLPLASCRQALEELSLNECSGLPPLPDLSGLEKLEVNNLQAKLKPWEEGGRKAFALPPRA